uniref:DNA ligase n=1 Tax=Candidatus Methanogaster sp. ANME-2c ERB4 TaxID=2759911 RepID=A0A7G9Y1K9_9EURY|nr:DNA ligase [Methanosarcinales archaeon ANME-2c ERB4]
MTTFKEFTDVCEEIEGISSSLEITTVVSSLLQRISESSDPDAELSIISRFVMGKVFPDWSAVELGVGPSLLYESISRTAGVPVKQIKQLIRETGDVGEAARVALEKGAAGSAGARATQTTFLDFTDVGAGRDDGESGGGDGCSGKGNGADGHLTIVEVFDRMLSIAQASGKGSQQIKIKNLQYLFGTASPTESRYIARIVLEELRIGVGEGLVRNAIAQAFGEDAGAVERSYMLINDLGEVAVTALHHDLEQVSIRIGRPIKPMLAQIGSFDDVTGLYAAEWKFDGARVQIHKNGDNIRIFSRRLENVTKSLPDVVNMIKSQVTANQAILDGEVVATGPAGKPLAFQEIMRRFRRKYKVSAMAEKVPLHLNLFDIMYLDGDALIDEPLHIRRKQLESVVRPHDGSARISVAEQVVTNDPEVAHAVYQAALDAGHEGIMLKNPDSAYSPGKRGKNWLKIKPIMETLDLVVVGANWGEGRRANLIGSYMLACYDPDTAEFLEIGRVGTGITDEQLAELTELFSQYIISEDGGAIELKPAVVFEIAYEEIQRSTHYASGYALRFPRLVRVRFDKTPEDADNVERVGMLAGG